MPAAADDRARPRVLIAGGGVAGLETLLALRALAEGRVDITLLSPELKFVNVSMSVEQPFKLQRGRGLRPEDTAAELGAGWHRGALDRVEHDRHRVVTKEGDELVYDILVLALGARPEREWWSRGVLTYHGGRDGPNFRLLLHKLREGGIDKVAFVKPAGASWPLPLYDLVLMTATDCAAHERPGVELSLVTQRKSRSRSLESPPAPPSARSWTSSGWLCTRATTACHARPDGWRFSPGDQVLAVDRIVTQPRLVGPSLRGIPSARDGFIQTDPHGRLAGVDDVFAAGDATTFPVKQGGIAAQQADAVAEAIAASAGADIDPQPFRPNPARRAADRRPGALSTR
jgi:sulfide:quinone oxidoreductase